MLYFVILENISILPYSFSRMHANFYLHADLLADFSRATVLLGMTKHANIVHVVVSTCKVGYLHALNRLYKGTSILSRQSQGI